MWTHIMFTHMRMHWFARRTTAALAVATCLVAGSAACGSDNGAQETKIVVPSAATSTPEYASDGSVPDQRYVIRMSDGQRDWEVEFPEVATGYEMHIPLDERDSQSAGGGMEWESDNLTAADREILRQKRRRNQEMEREGVYEGGENVSEPRSGDRDEPPKEEERPGLEKRGDQESQRRGRSGKSTEARPAPSRPSYLKGLHEVRQLYRAGNYEIAWVRLKKLEEAYPDDEKILSMKGTLALKLGEVKIAREAWERVLQINESNEKVREALKRLNENQTE